jgi:hypothetical protein
MRKRGISGLADLEGAGVAKGKDFPDSDDAIPRYLPGH